MELSPITPEVAVYLKGHEIIASNYSYHAGNLLVASRAVETGELQILRAFTLSDKVNVSIDIRSNDIEQVLENLVTRR